jgi:hypothetical protein
VLALVFSFTHLSDVILSVVMIRVVLVYGMLLVILLIIYYKICNIGQLVGDGHNWNYEKNCQCSHTTSQLRCVTVDNRKIVLEYGP